MSARIDPVLAIRECKTTAAKLTLLARLLVEGPPGAMKWRREIATAIDVVAREVAR